MTKLLLIDERDCFAPIRNHVSQPQLQVELLEPQYFLAPNPSFFNQMVTAALQCDITVIHRKIWIDECDSDDDCTRLNEFENTIKPRPVLKVGGMNTTHKSCPGELLFVYQQLSESINRLGGLIGIKVKPLNTEKSPYLTISKLEIIGGNIVGCVLKTIDGDNRKYYRLIDLQPYRD